jgi:hypothetical protein
MRESDVTHTQLAAKQVLLNIIIRQATTRIIRFFIIKTSFVIYFAVQKLSPSSDVAFLHQRKFDGGV